MILSRFYRKKLRLSIAFVSAVAILLLLLKGYFFTNPHTLQLELENEALSFHNETRFNPRSATSAVLKHINSPLGSLDDPFKDGVLFHWDDWIDLSPADHLLDPYRLDYPQGFCDKAITKLAEVSAYLIEPYEKKVLRGMIHMYCLKDIPQQLVVSTDGGYIEVPVAGKRRMGDAFECDADKSSTIEQVVLAETGRTHDFKRVSMKPFSQSMNISAQRFRFDPRAEIDKLHSETTSLSSQSTQYLEFLEYANSYVDHAEAYFKYPWIIDDFFEGHSHHFAYPFFKRYVSDRERQSVIHHMVRTWFQFAQAYQIVSWINYGSLIGWIHNGVNLPWDTDVDIQVPIADLARVALKLNGSLVLEDPRYGNAKYLLEISPTFVRQGNSKNFIDARFIEVNSGIYIDISALSESNFTPPDSLYKGLTEEEAENLVPLNCKNWNWHAFDEIFPLNHTLFEGGSAYVPHKVTDILDRKYGRSSYTTDTHFSNHDYREDLSLWVPNRVCKANVEDESACENMIHDEYRITYPTTQRHKMGDPFDLEDLPLLRKDPYDYYYDIREGLVSNADWFYKQEMV